MPRALPPLRTRAMIRAIGRRVRAHRVASHLTQGQLGRKANVSAKFIGEIERGTHNSSIVTLLFIAEGLGCTLAQLIQDESSTGYVVLSADEMRRVKDAATLIYSALTPSIGKFHYVKGHEPTPRQRKGRELLRHPRT
jgi:transcriptional regulator with XRE-family HTH domain